MKVVVPPNAAAREPSSADWALIASVTSMLKCTCASMPPGTTQPSRWRRSSRRRPPAAPRERRSARCGRPTMPRSARTDDPPVTTLPPRDGQVKHGRPTGGRGRSPWPAGTCRPGPGSIRRPSSDDDEPARDHGRRPAGHRAALVRRVVGRHVQVGDCVTVRVSRGSRIAMSASAPAAERALARVEAVEPGRVRRHHLDEALRRHAAAWRRTRSKTTGSRVSTPGRPFGISRTSSARSAFWRGVVAAVVAADGADQAADQLIGQGVDGRAASAAEGSTRSARGARPRSTAVVEGEVVGHDSVKARDAAPPGGGHQVDRPGRGLVHEVHRRAGALGDGQHLADRRASRRPRAGSRRVLAAPMRPVAAASRWAASTMSLASAWT